MMLGSNDEGWAKPENVIMENGIEQVQLQKRGLELGSSHMWVPLAKNLRCPYNQHCEM